MLSGINLVHFLNWSGNTLLKKDEKTLFVCPFNKEKRTTCIASELGRPCAAHTDEKDFVLTVDVKAKILSCALCGEKNTWNIVDYVKKLHNYQNGDAYQHLLAYWQEAKVSTKTPYAIIARTRQKIVLRIDDRTYTLTDVKFKKLHDFSMTIMLEHGSTPPLFCEVNLTGGKRREEFVSETKAHFSFSEEIIQSDITILQQAVRDLQEEYSQKQQDEIQSAKKKFEPTDTETTEAMKTLREKELVFDELMRDMEAIGFTGDETVKAIFKEITATGIKVSMVSVAFIWQQMIDLKLDGCPVIDAKTFQGWSQSGFKVKKGEHAQLHGITWITSKCKNEDENDKFIFPKVYKLFHKSQVQPI